MSSLASVVGSEIEGGVRLADLSEGACLEVETENHMYLIVKTGGEAISISGHPRYCPHPIEVQLGGPRRGGSLLKSSYIGPGMRLEFWHPAHDLVTTTRIRSIRQAYNLGAATPDSFSSRNPRLPAAH